MRFGRLARNTNGTYSPANASNLGELVAAISNLHGMAWDGRQLVIAAPNLWTLWTAPDNEAPEITAIAANPTIIDSGGTTALTATVTDPNPGDTLTYQWVSSVGGTFGDNMADEDTGWTDAGTALEAQSVTLTLTATDDDGLTHSRSVTVTVRTPGGPPLALPDPR